MGQIIRNRSEKGKPDNRFSLPSRDICKGSGDEECDKKDRGREEPEGVHGGEE